MRGYMKGSYVDIPDEYLSKTERSKLTLCKLSGRIKDGREVNSKWIDIDCDDKDCMCSEILKPWREAPWSKMPKFR